MSTPNDAAAFPTPGRIELRPVQGPKGGNYEHKIPPKDGMTLRDYFATQALAGLLANPSTKLEDNDGIRAAAEFTYDIADAMLKARDR
jgi:hypothetical protein